MRYSVVYFFQTHPGVVETVERPQSTLIGHESTIYDPSAYRI